MGSKTKLYLFLKSFSINRSSPGPSVDLPAGTFAAAKGTDKNMFEAEMTEHRPEPMPCIAKNRMNVQGFGAKAVARLLNCHHYSPRLIIGVLRFVRTK